MSDITAALAALYLHTQPDDQSLTSTSSPASFTLTSPTQHCEPKAFASRPVRLFPDTKDACSHVSHAASKAEWSTVIGDIFQAVIKLLPAHTAQYAMLVCQHWHNSVTCGLLQLRPRILDLHNIAVR